jgi:hypothetical protein
MTILASLEEVKALVPVIRTFIYADLNEANATETDKLIASELPCMIVLPIQPIDNFPNSGSGLVKTTFELNAFFLMKSANITSDYSSKLIETECIEPMRFVARQFIHNLQTHEIIDPETAGITSVNYTPAYSSMDANLYGVQVRCTVPVIENPVLC